MARVLVLGLGNDILTDDAVGLHVAQAVRERLAGEPGIEVKSTTEMGLALLDEIADRDGVVLVDSVQTGRAPPGHIHEVDAAALASIASTVPHMLGIGETLALGQLLGLAMPRRVRVFAIEVADPFSLGTEMTGAVRDSVTAAADRIIAAARELAGAGAAAISAPQRPKASDSQGQTPERGF
jgi:hydrogenase maturation protease